MQGLDVAVAEQEHGGAVVFLHRLGDQADGLGRGLGGDFLRFGIAAGGFQPGFGVKNQCLLLAFGLGHHGDAFAIGSGLPFHCLLHVG